MKIIFNIIFILFTLTSVRGQLLEYGVGIGGTLYWGDMNAPDFGTNVGNTNLGLQVMAKLNFSEYTAIKANLLYGKLSGDDSKSSMEWQKQRNLDFQSILLELAIQGEYHIFGYNFGDENPISPYVTAGASLFYFNPTTVYQGQKVSLQPLGTEGQGLPGFDSKYNKVAFAIPFGAGMKYKVNDNLNLSIDIVTRKTFTDYIDDLSKSYVNYTELANGNGELAARLGNRQGEYFGQAEPVDLPTGAQRGGAGITDYYFSFMVTFTYKLNKNLSFLGRHKGRTDCPKF